MSLGQPFICRTWTTLGPNLLPTSLDCTEHEMPTHPQAEDVHQLLHADWDPITSKPEGPQVTV